MFGRVLDGVQSVDGKMGGTELPGAAAASSGVASQIYQIVQMTQPDGKQLLKLLPISETLGNADPSIHVPVVSDNTKINVSVPGFVSLNTAFTKSTAVLSNTTTSSLVKIPALLTEAPGKLILQNQLDKVELVKVTHVNGNQTINASAIQNNYISSNNLSLQKDATLMSSVKSNILVNTNNLPVLNTSVMPSGHHLQIHSYAKVKSVPASCLSPAIQHKILPVVATNASVTSEAPKPPNVIYVSPVKIVKTPISTCLQNVNPTPAAEIAKPLGLTSAQTAVSNSVPDTVLSSVQKPREGPMKWIVQENPESSASCLVPVRSSNDMVSKILKTLVDRKNVKNNPANILPACSGSLTKSQAKLSSVKDNALVMYNGKVYLLARKGSSTESALDDKQVSASANTDFRKHTSQITSLDGDNITNQVVNLVLSKNKGVALSAKHPKSCETIKLPLWSEWNQTLKAAPVLLTSPHGNLQPAGGSVSQQEALSASENTPVGIKFSDKIAAEDLNVSLMQKTLFPLQSSTFAVSKEEEQKVEINSIEMAGHIKQRTVQHRKQYTEMRKKFGLLKEERVYLTRLSLFNSNIKTEETEWSSNVHTNDSVTVKPDPEETMKADPEEKMILGKQETDVKRKAELPELILENAKRRKTLGSGLDHDDSSSGTDDPSSFCRQVISQQENPTVLLPFSSNGYCEPNISMQSNEDSEVLCPTLQNIENETTLSAGSLGEDSFLFSPPDLEETIKDEKIERLKLLLKKQEAALEEMCKKLQET